MAIRMTPWGDDYLVHRVGPQLAPSALRHRPTDRLPPTLNLLSVQVCVPSSFKAGAA